MKRPPLNDQYRGLTRTIIIPPYFSQTTFVAPQNYTVDVKILNAQNIVNVIEEWYTRCTQLVGVTTGIVTWLTVMFTLGIFTPNQIDTLRGCTETYLQSMQKSRQELWSLLKQEAEFSNSPFNLALEDVYFGNEVFHQHLHWYADRLNEKWLQDVGLPFIVSEAQTVEQIIRAETNYNGIQVHIILIRLILLKKVNPFVLTLILFEMQMGI